MIRERIKTVDGLYLQGVDFDGRPILTDSVQDAAERHRDDIMQMLADVLTAHTGILFRPASEREAER